jgi:hypothetical protein
LDMYLHDYNTFFEISNTIVVIKILLFSITFSVIGVLIGKKLCFENQRFRSLRLAQEF